LKIPMETPTICQPLFFSRGFGPFPCHCLLTLQKRVQLKSPVVVGCSVLSDAHGVPHEFDLMLRVASIVSELVSANKLPVETFVESLRSSIQALVGDSELVLPSWTRIKPLGLDSPHKTTVSMINSLN